MTLTHSPANIIRWLFVALGLCADPNGSPLGAWPGYATSEPNMPDECVTVYNTQGRDDGRTMVDGEVLTHFGIQVRVRSKDNPTGWTKADLIRGAMQKTVRQNTVHIGTSTYVVWALGKIGNTLDIGKNVPSTKRSLFTINCVAAITQTS